MPKSTISIYFDGPITEEHAVQLRIFGKTLMNIQSAIDRAYLDIRTKGKIYKNARISRDDYEHTNFLMNQSRPGSFAADLLSHSEESGNIVKRINSAVSPAYEEAQTYVPKDEDNLVTQAKNRAAHYSNNAQIPEAYDDAINGSLSDLRNSYGNRSIAKEFGEISTMIAARENDGSYIKISLYTENFSTIFTFDHQTSESFKKIVSKKELGDLIEIPITIRSLDSQAVSGLSAKAIAINTISKKSFNLYIHSEDGFNNLKDYLQKKDPPVFKIIACPVLEYGSFDPNAGDMYFLAISQ